MDMAKTKIRKVNRLALVLAILLAGVILNGTLTACAEPLLYAKTQQVIAVTRSYTQGYDKVFDAAKWALIREKYSIIDESRSRGTLITNWTPSTPDSHYVEVFGRRDYGTTGSYYHLDLAIYQDHGHIQVVVRSITKSLVNRLHSTGITENKILDDTHTYLLGKDIEITNLGISKP